MVNKKVSIIIPVKEINDYIKESIPKILELDYSDFEILIFTNQEDTKHKWPKTKIIASGDVGPADKRDLAIKYAKGEILAFLDDDAYPEKDWLEKALVHFNNKKIAAVGGPAVTPKTNSLKQKMSATVFESYVGGAGARNRYLSAGQVQEVDDWPTVNLLVRKNIFSKLGGFDSHYWPGEDTKLCLDIINAGFKIIYEPQAVVYHHRREDLLRHFKQIGNYGLHRGFFAKIYPQTSFKLWYFVPSFFLVYLILVVMAFLLPVGSALFVFEQQNLLTILILPLVFYLLALIIDAVIIAFRWDNLLLGILTIPMIFLTHIYYGVRFIQGFFFTRKLSR